MKRQPSGTAPLLVCACTEISMSMHENLCDEACCPVRPALRHLEAKRGERGDDRAHLSEDLSTLLNIYADS